MRRTTTRDRLVRTAAELFWSQGYAQTGVNAIIRRAEATSGSFYHFFPTKEDLLIAVLDLADERLEAEVLGPAEDASDEPIERILLVLALHRKHLEDNQFRFGSPVGTLVGELGDDHTEARRRVAEIFEGLVSRIEGWLLEVGDRWPSGVRHRCLAELVVASVEGAVAQARARRDLAPVDACAEQLRIHLLLLAGPEGSPVRPPISASEAFESGVADWKSW